MTDYFHISMSHGDILNISSLGLAHIGDGVFELMVRSWLCLRGKVTSKGLHKATVGYVSAPSQAAMAERILPILSEEESEVFRRGRNTAPHSVPKASSRGQYQTATALEALFGWLYLRGEHARLRELFDIAFAENEEKNDEVSE